MTGGQSRGRWAVQPVRHLYCDCIVGDRRLAKVVLAATASVVVGLAGCSKPASQKAATAPTAKPAAAHPISNENDVLMQHGDWYRTGATVKETRLKPATVHSEYFGRLFEWSVDGQIYTQPLYVSDITYHGRQINMVVVATTNNSVYAFEAPAPTSDVKPSDTPLWWTQNNVLGAPLPFNFFFMPSGIFGYNIYPLIGITATPVIDRASQTIYVTVKSKGSADSAAAVKYELVALNLLDGAVRHRTVITASGKDAKGKTITFDPKVSLQRASLLMANERIYAAFGSHQDTTPYNGWIIAFEAGDLTYAGAYCTTCLHQSHSNMGGIWQAGAGLALDGDGKGNLYVITGNGSYGKEPADPAGTVDTGTSFIKLDKDLHVIGSWTPATFACLNRTDTDLGSAGPTFLSDSATLIGGGKEGVLYALKPEALQGVQVGAVLSPNGNSAPCEGGPTPAANGAGYSSIRATPPWKMDGIMDWLRRLVNPLAAQGFHHIHGSPVQWNVKSAGANHHLLYVSGERDVLRAFEYPKDFSNGPGLTPQPQDSFESECKNSDHGMPGGFLTLSANGDDPNSGIVWAAMPRYDKNALTNVVPGILRAYRAYPEPGSTRLTEIWNSDSGMNIPAGCPHKTYRGPDQVGSFAKFVPPTVAEGKVYLSTFGGALAVYGLKSAGGVEALTAGKPNFDATLHIQNPAASVAAGAAVTVSISATNTGASPWHAADGIRLSSQLVADREYTPVEGSEVLNIQRDVRRGESYVFNFHLTAPKDEAVHYFSWRLRRTRGVTKQPGGDWFGNTSEEWRFATLRSECNPLRERARRLIDQVKSSALSAKTLRSNAAQEREVESLQQQAQKSECSLASELIEPMDEK